MRAVSQLCPAGAPAWHHVLVLLLALGFGLASAEVGWAEAPTGGDAQSVSVDADGSTPQTRTGPQSPPRHQGHDATCPCLCACPCPGAVGPVVPIVSLCEVPVDVASPYVPPPGRMPASTAPEPLLRPPLQ